MRIKFHSVLTTALLLGTSTARGQEIRSNKPDSDSIFKELSAGLPKEGQRAISARLELEYWNQSTFAFLLPTVREKVKTNDGKAAEVVFLTAPSMSIPGEDFSMAFLLVDKKVIDWASCWTYNRTATQKLCLEDVDEDGIPDVAFRAGEGWFGLADKRQHSRPNDTRKWLYAYAITAKGFQSIFPSTERDLKVKVAYDSSEQSVKLEAKGLPEACRERQMVEMTVSATNTSDKNLTVERDWLELTVDAQTWISYRLPKDRTVLKPGESISQVVRLFLVSTEKEATVRCKFVANPKKRFGVDLLPSIEPR